MEGHTIKWRNQNTKKEKENNNNNKTARTLIKTGRNAGAKDD